VGYFYDKLGRNSTWNWEEEGRAKILPIDDHRFGDDRFVLKQIQLLAKKNPRISYHVFVLGDKKYRDALAPANEALWDVRFAHIDKDRVARRVIRALQDFHLDWKGNVESELVNFWQHCKVDRDRLDSWLEQFDRLGGNRWIGEGLLRSLDLWAVDRVKKALNLTADQLTGYDEVCVNTEQMGKSGSILSFLIRKTLESLKKENPHSQFPLLKDLKHAFDEDKIKSILYIEDCLLSGTEMCNILKCLLGKCPDGRKPKVSPLSDASRLSQKHVQFRFAIAADFGCANLERLLENENLATSEIYNQPPNNRLAVLTQDGLEALHSGTLWSSSSASGESERLLRDPGKHMRLLAFRDIRDNETEGRAKKAIKFCRCVGEQLFSHYIDLQIRDEKWYPWSKRRIQEYALGTRSLGLAIIFAYSVPKGSLPLFWASGDVEYRGEEIPWSPLFEIKSSDDGISQESDEIGQAVGMST